MSADNGRHNSRDEYRDDVDHGAGISPVSPADPPNRAFPVHRQEPLIRPQPTAVELIRAAPEVAQVAATSAWHALRWSVGASLASANYVVRRAIDGQPPTAIIQEAAHDLRDVAVRALGLGANGVPLAHAQTTFTDDPDGAAAATPADLQQRGDDLLRRSNDVHVVEDTHPAFARILTEITPDEARILRFLYVEGPQPSVDVRTWRPFGIGSVLVAQRLTMLAEQAGCRNLERTSQYLTNLARLGLVDLSSESVSDPQRYQVIEAQPSVTEAMQRAGRMPRTVHGSILLTSFGSEFVLTCLPVDGRSVPRRALHSGDDTSDR